MVMVGIPFLTSFVVYTSIPCFSKMLKNHPKWLDGVYKHIVAILIIFSDFQLLFSWFGNIFVSIYASVHKLCHYATISTIQINVQ